MEKQHQSLPLNKLTMYIVSEFIVILIIVCINTAAASKPAIASTTGVTSGAPIPYEMFLHFPHNASINVVIDLNANDDSTDSDIQDILIAMMKIRYEAIFEKNNSKAKRHFDRKESPLNQSIDAAIKSHYSSRNMFNPKQLTIYFFRG